MGLDEKLLRIAAAEREGMNRSKPAGKGSAEREAHNKTLPNFTFDKETRRL